MLILDLWGIGFHAVVVFGLGKEFLLKSILGCCVKVTQVMKWSFWQLHDLVYLAAFEFDFDLFV